MEKLSQPKKITQLKNRFFFHYTNNTNKLIITLEKNSEPFSPNIESIQIGSTALESRVKIDQKLKAKLENRIREFSKTQLISAI